MSHLLRQSLIFTILATTAIGLLAWSWSVNSDPDAETPTAQKPASPRLSTVKTHAAKEAESINFPQPANIDANARLRALYERYPELAIESHSLDLNLDNQLALHALCMTHPCPFL